MKPGRSVASPRSMVSAPAGTAAFAPTPAIFPSVMTIKPGIDSALLLPSKIRAAFSTYVLLAFCVCPRAGSTGPATKPTSSQPHDLRMDSLLFGSFSIRFPPCPERTTIACSRKKSRIAWRALRSEIAYLKHDMGSAAFFMVFHTLPQGSPSVLLTPLLSAPTLSEYGPLFRFFGAQGRGALPRRRRPAASFGHFCR